MAQIFEYPNLVSSTRKGKLGFTADGVTVTKAHMSDDVVGDYERFTVTDNKYGKPGWAYAYIYTNLSAVLALPSGNECTSVFAARASEQGFVPASFFLTARNGDGTKELFTRVAQSVIGIGGGWFLFATKLERNDVGKSNQPIYMWLGGPKYAVGDTIDIAQPAIFLGTTPRAWAPAAGEVWP